MIEHTEAVATPDGTAIEVRRAATPGQFIGFAGSDVARGETLLRRDTVIGSREIGMLAACGLATIPVHRRPRVGVLSTGDELVAPGLPLRPAAIHDCNGPIVCAAIAENGGEPVFYGACPDEEAALDAAIRRAFADCDMVVLSGGTSKGAGDLSHRLVARLGAPGIIAHGVALKPGKPLCLAVCDGKAVVVLPGFPTSAMFTFHDVIVPPLIAASPACRPGPATKVAATVAVRIASELGRTEFVMVSLVDGRGRARCVSDRQRLGRDHRLLASRRLPAVHALWRIRLTPAPRPRSRCSARIARCPTSSSWAATMSASTPSRRGSPAWVHARACSSPSAASAALAAARRGECDIAPIHLLDPKTGAYNAPFLSPGLDLVRGLAAHAGRGLPPWRRAFRGPERDGSPRGGARRSRLRSWSTATPAPARAS